MFLRLVNGLSFSFGSLWNPESTREREKNTKKNDFLIFDSRVENIIKIIQNFTYF